jgi:hypothetical protein
MITLDRITNKIMAIKAIKELPVAIDYVTVENGVLTPNLKVNLSLKEAKDLVETIMALQDSQYIVDNLKAEVKALKESGRILEERFNSMRSAIYNALDKNYPPFEDSNEPSF